MRSSAQLSKGKPHYVISMYFFDKRRSEQYSKNLAMDSNRTTKWWIVYYFLMKISGLGFGWEHLKSSLLESLLFPTLQTKLLVEVVVRGLPTFPLQRIQLVKEQALLYFSCVSLTTAQIQLNHSRVIPGNGSYASFARKKSRQNKGGYKIFKLLRKRPERIRKRTLPAWRKLVKSRRRNHLIRTNQEVTEDCGFRCWKKIVKIQRAKILFSKYECQKPLATKWGKGHQRCQGREPNSCGSPKSGGHRWTVQKGQTNICGAVLVISDRMEHCADIGHFRA